MDVEPIEDFELMAKMKRSIIPILWIDEGVALKNDFTDKIRYGIYW